MTDHHPAQAIFRHTWETSKKADFFFEKLQQSQQKPFFLNQRPPPLDFKKYFFSNGPKSYFYQSHCIAFGLTIPKWYNTWVLKIFLEIFLKIFEKKIQKNIFEKNIYKKYFQYPSVIPFWNRETQCNAMALIEIWFRAIWKKIFF